jgi:ATP-binding cassette subfamily F protein uup
VLLLDEPTNDLDIDTLQQLEDLLDSWPGTLVVVSHDRYLVERVCDGVYALLGDGRVTHLPGGIDEYLMRRARAIQVAAPAAPGPAQARSGAAEHRAAMKELGRLERRLDQLAKRETELHEQLAVNATNPDKLVELNAELKTVLTEKDDVEARWLETSEFVE